MKKPNIHLHTVSYNFKVFMVWFIFLIVGLKLIFLHYYPSVEILPDKALLASILIIMLYLWVQAMQDRANLVNFNKDLMTAYEQLKQAEIDTISALIKTVEARDPYTCGHSERVTKIAVEIAKAMNVDPDVQERIGKSARLHDIGKIGINDAILLKKEKLTDEEWARLREHPQKGAEILKSLKFLQNEMRIILHHHERLDGKGYPEGLKKEEIPLEAQIISVADTFDAMNTVRPYRQALSREYIIEELKRVGGTQLSPKVVEIFLDLLDKKQELWNTGL